MRRPAWSGAYREAFPKKGLTLRAIADALNVESVPTAQGGAKWYASTVSFRSARPTPTGVWASAHTLRSLNTQVNRGISNPLGFSQT